jgi:hypothetical protein
MSFGVLDIRSGTVSGHLPCGIIGQDGQLHNTFVVHEMTGVEEDLLAGKGAVVPRLNKILANCSDSIGAISDKREVELAIKKLTAVDRMVMLINVRRASLGDDYNLKITCPKCSSSGRYKIDLSWLETKPMNDPMKRKFVSETTRGRKIHWHVMSGEDETWMQQQLKKLKDKEMLTVAMLARIDKIDDVELDRRNDLKGAFAALKALSLRDRNDIRGFFTEMEGTIDTEVEHECPDCGHGFSGQLDVGQPGFFFPAGVPGR